MELLTNKAKELFLQWTKQHEEDHEVYCNGWEFNAIPFSMQWGVYLEWADSMGYYLNHLTSNVGNTMRCEHSISICDSMDNCYCETKDYITRKEAQIAAIKQLNNIINGTTNN